jgi:nucleotide-binding universal stress UspA family protein
MKLSKICVPVALQRYVPFPPVALRQRELAMVLALHYKAELHFLTVDGPVTLLPHLEETASKLKRLIEPLAQFDTLKVSIAHREGKPSKEIRTFVDEIAADAVIIGSHSKRSALDVGVGSTASALRHDMKATVIMIRPTTDETAQAKELMIPAYPFVFPYG